MLKYTDRYTQRKKKIGQQLVSGTKITLKYWTKDDQGRLLERLVTC